MKTGGVISVCVISIKGGYINPYHKRKLATGITQFYFSVY